MNQTALNFIATEATEEVNEMEIINRLVYLVRTGMGLDQSQVVTYNQMIPIPPDDRIFIAIGILDSKPYAGSLSYHPVPTTPTDGLHERQTSNSRDVFSLHIMSKSNEARRRRQEVGFALTGTLATQMQERYGFLIGKLPIGFVDSSITDGAERLNRYTITFAVLSAQQAERPVPFFDSFQGSPAIKTEN